MSDELSRLRAENARLRALLACHGIAVDELENMSPRKPALSLEEKVTLFRSLFQGREDAFARRWFSNSTGKSGYQPVCSREWNREFCDKKKFKCTECPNREFQPLGYNDIYSHLEGKDPNGRDVVGVYAILPDNTCRFLCCDFDDKSCEWIESEAARKLLGVSPKTWQNHRDQRLIPFSQIGRKIYVNRADLDAFLRKHRIDARK